MTNDRSIRASPPPDAVAERVAVIGYGSIGRRLVAMLRATIGDARAIGVLAHHPGDALRSALAPSAIFADLDALIAWRPTLVVECATQDVVATCVARVLAAGIDVVVVSVGALADPALRRAIDEGSRTGGGRLTWVSGALGGLDALRAARIAGLDRVTYVGRKPPAAWKGSDAERLCDLDALTGPTTFFRGNAGEAALRFPKNANVAAAIALDGAGFEATRVELVADPQVTRNVHAIRAEGAFGTLAVDIECAPLPDNPRTSWLAASSVEAVVRARLARTGIPEQHPLERTP